MKNKLRWSFAAAAVGIAFGAVPTLAQRVPDMAVGRPGMSKIDMTDPAASKQDPNLKGHPVPPTVTPLDKLPLDKIKLPAGFKAEVWSHGHPGARTMVFRHLFSLRAMEGKFQL